jgi:uncharacterized membrane protein HdeD (DUF308 family)
MSLAVLVLLFGFYALLDGIVAIVIGARERGREHAWAVMLEGFVGVGLGLAAVMWMRAAAEFVVILIALWAIATGLLEAIVAVRWGRELLGHSLIALSSVASILLGFAVLLSATTATFGLLVLLGSYGVVFGAAMLAHAFRLRAAMKRLETQPPHGARTSEPHAAR